MNIIQKERIAAFRSHGESYAKIADALGISKNTVQSYCRRNNLGGDSSTVVEKETEKESRSFCKQCSVELIQQPGKKPRKFCSDACRAEWWKTHPEQLEKKAVYTFKCVHCGNDFTAYGNDNRKYCSHECYVADRFRKAAAS
jgi:predicted transcriptional regulator